MVPEEETRPGLGGWVAGGSSCCHAGHKEREGHRGRYGAGRSSFCGLFQLTGQSRDQEFADQALQLYWELAGSCPLSFTIKISKRGGPASAGVITAGIWFIPTSQPC